MSRQLFQQQLALEFPEEFSVPVSTHWDELKSSILTTCQNTLGHRQKKHQDWFDSNDQSLKELIDQKRTALMDFKKDPKSTAKKAAYQQKKAIVQRETRRLKNKWWTDKAKEIQGLADRNDTRGFFSATKAVYGPSTHGQAPLRSKDGTNLLKTKTEINARWKEHFEDLLNTNPVIDEEEVLGVLPEHDLAENLAITPTLEETKQAIHSLKNNKAPDDNSVASHTEAGLQATLEAFNFAYTKLGLNINLRKTQVLHQPCPNDANPQPPAIVLQGQTLENVEHFCYLGSHLSSKADIDIEIQHRLQGAGAAFGKLRTRVFRNRDIQTETKIRVNTWETAAKDRSEWISAIHHGTKTFEETKLSKAEEKRQIRKERKRNPNRQRLPPNATCPTCGKQCASRLGLLSHQRVHAN
ncbi:hypothetical protein Pmani_001262 [Petrolisthes manimaculis]|uniref:C2H2-type domain-containing protein n=1 Tax=Petrolisthes manimaculis TaxID=1843537 RepID=A0AAE1QMI4_9EUCA|nr:hypothetical protein Pmani_001262 [Petrolisthes manimaculis]